MSNFSSLAFENRKSRFHFIIDRSGSMYNCKGNLLKALNEQIEYLRKISFDNPNEDIKSALHFFNHDISSLHVGIEAKHVPLINEGEYIPDGNTALYDAIGQIASREYKITKEAVEGNKVNSVFVILSDGYENASKYFTFESTRSLILEMQESGYVFVFMAAFADGHKVAENLMVRKENTRVFSKSELKSEFDKVGVGFEKMIRDKMGGKNRNFFE